MDVLTFIPQKYPKKNTLSSLFYGFEISAIRSLTARPSALEPRVMVIFEAPAVAEPMESLDNQPDQIEKVFSVFVTSEYSASYITSCGRRVEGTRVFYPERTSPIAILIIQDLTPCHSLQMGQIAVSGAKPTLHFGQKTES